MKVNRKQALKELIDISEYKNTEFLIKRGNIEAKKDGWNKLIRINDNTYYCTNCQKIHHDKKVKINLKKRCKNCNTLSKVITKRNIIRYFQCYLTTIEVNKRNELILRSFSFKKHYDKNKMENECEVIEVFRKNVDRNITIKRYVNCCYYNITFRYSAIDRWKELTSSYSWHDIVKFENIIEPNFKRKIMKTKYRYACLRQASKYIDIEEYLKLYNIFPEAEMLVKMNMMKYLKEITLFKEDVEKIRSFLKENKRFFKIWSKTDPTAREMQTMVDLDTYDIDIARKAIKVRWIKDKNMYADDIKLIRYLFDQGKDMSYWLDYIEFLEKLRIKIDKEKMFPKDLEKEHDKMFNKLEVFKNDEYKDDIIEFEKMIRPYNFENNDYIIRCAKSVEELVNESKEMDHCVRDYIPKIAAHQSAIFFLRKKENEDQPLVTVEIDPVNKILLQARGYHNYEPKINEMSFINEWCNKKIIDNSMLTYTI